MGALLIAASLGKKKEVTQPPTIPTSAGIVGGGYQVGHIGSSAGFENGTQIAQAMDAGRITHRATQRIVSRPACLSAAHASAQVSWKISVSIRMNLWSLLSSGGLSLMRTGS